jgi:hypothetical protein
MPGEFARPGKSNQMQISIVKCLRKKVAYHKAKAVPSKNQPIRMIVPNR